MAVTMVIVRRQVSHRIGVHLFQVYFRPFLKKVVVVQHVWDSLSYKRRKSALFPKARCRLCSYNQPTNMGITSKGSQRYFCSVCKHSFTDTFDTLYYRRQLKPEEVHTILQSHARWEQLKRWLEQWAS